MKPLAEWCNAEFIQQRVHKIEGDRNRLHLQNNQIVDYDVLALNIGSKTKDTGNIKGVVEHSLTTRPINDLLPKIRKREAELLEMAEIPVVVICGAGAAGTELAFAFKRRWTDLFGKEIQVSLICADQEPLFD